MATEKNNSNKKLLITGFVLVIVAAGAFYGGMLYQKSQGRGAFSQYAATGQGRAGQGGGIARQGGRGFGGAIVGDILSIDNDSLTIKLQDGSSKIVNLSGSTTYSKTDTGVKADLKTGTKIAAIGSTGSDGSITAQNIQINPAFRMMGRPEPTQPK